MTETERVPAEATHPSIFINEELEARGWSIADLAMRMPGDFGINSVALEFYLTIGPDEPGLRMGDCAEGVSRAFGVDPDLFGNLERTWLQHPATKAAIAKELH